jgi:hypothetical protein
LIRHEDGLPGGDDAHVHDFTRVVTAHLDHLTRGCVLHRPGAEFDHDTARDDLHGHQVISPDQAGGLNVVAGQQGSLLQTGGDGLSHGGIN